MLAKINKLLSQGFSSWGAMKQCENFDVQLNWILYHLQYLHIILSYINKLEYFHKALLSYGYWHHYTSINSSNSIWIDNSHWMRHGDYCILVRSHRMKRVGTSALSSIFLKDRWSLAIYYQIRNQLKFYVALSSVLLVPVTTQGMNPILDNYFEKK